MPGLESASAIIPTVVALPKSYRSPGRTRRSGARPYRERIVPHWFVEAPSDHGDDDRCDVKNPPYDGNAEINVSFNGGAIIPHVRVQLLFWGNQWTQQNVSPSISSVISAIQKILAGPYMSALGQYGIGPGTLSGATIITWPGPPNPFFTDDWHTLIWDLIDNGTFPKPESPDTRNFYCFVLPPEVNFNDPNAVGAHGSPGDYDFPSAYDRVWAGWVMNDGRLDTVTRRFSHELVEACTDPEDDGWTIDG
jgi:hypothetical protein